MLLIKKQMNKKGFRREIRQLLILLQILILLILVIAWMAPKPPIREFKTYHALSGNSHNTHSSDYESYTNANTFRDMAFEEWHSQNTRFFLKRNFTQSERMILIAISFIEEANKKTQKKTIIL